MTKFLFALALLVVATAASALSLFPPSHPGSYPVATQSVSAAQHAPVAAAAAMDHAVLKTAASGTGAASAYQAWLASQRVAGMHSGCDQREANPIAKKGGKGKSGGGKKCIDVGLRAAPLAPILRST